MPLTFSDVISSEDQLRDVLGYPHQRSVAKTITELDDHCRAFIAKSPFVLIASSGADGSLDVSPKGDPAGFVQVLDDHMLAIPDRPGNRRADTFRNLLQNPNIGLLFMIPGNGETLRVNGTAQIVRDEWVRAPMAVQGKIPDFAIVVHVQEAFIHCPKCIIRSKMWDTASAADLDGVPTMDRMLIDHAKLDTTLEEMQALIAESIRERLY